MSATGMAAFQAYRVVQEQNFIQDAIRRNPRAFDHRFNKRECF